ncbi:MAG: hypothetical protein GYB66_00325 [Chloroflexi bacterium]|nr:hypothetical protein [Chloroflexota bacterium]
MMHASQRFLQTWSPRVGFASLLLVFGELVTWHRAGTYSFLDWLAVIAIYLALGALLLDGLVRRFQAGWDLPFLLVGIFGLLNSGFVSLALYQNLPLSLVFFATGAQTLAFLLAYVSFRWLYFGHFPLAGVFPVSVAVGLVCGLWLRGLTRLESVDVQIGSIELAEVLPIIIVAMFGAASIKILLPLPQRIAAQNLLLTPMDGVIAGLALFVLVLLRAEAGFLPPLGLLVAGVVLGMLLLLLWFSNADQNKQFFDWPVISSHQRVVPGMLGILVFGLAASASYAAPVDPELQAALLFWSLIMFGVIWPPLVSVLVSIRIFVELEQEEF